jgi:hypothetical protein
MDILAGFVIALLLGGMVFFSFVFSPLVFVKLPAQTAGPFIRQVFPWYFLVVAALFALAAPLTLAAPGLAALLAAMAALGFANRQILMPRINALRDRHLAGDHAAKRGFDRLHGASVAINFVQMAAAAWALYAILA